MKDEIPARGNLNYYSLPKVLIFLNKQRKTGILTLANKNIRKSIYLKNGNVIFASSNQEEERLGQLLVKAGKITPEQLEKSLELLKKTVKRHGTVLVELGYINPKELFQIVKSQVKDIILSLLLWEDGIFSFKEIEPPAEAITLNISTEKLIRIGVSINKKIKKEEEKLFLQKVNKNFANINRLSYYDILEIDIKASPSEIKKAYLKMARTYHPDKYIHLPNSSIKKKLTTLFTFINKAFKTLDDKVKKTEYDNILLKKIAIKDLDSDIIGVEEQFKRGMNEFKKGNFWGAADFFRWATRKDPQHANYWAYLSLALNNMPRRHKEAEETILKAIELEPHNSNYYVHLGTIYLQAGLKKRAIEQFNIALKWDPTNKKALEELEKSTGKK